MINIHVNVFVNTLVVSVGATRRQYSKCKRRLKRHEASTSIPVDSIDFLYWFYLFTSYFRIFTGGKKQDVAYIYIFSKKS